MKRNISLLFRIIGLVKPIVMNFKKEESLQAAIATVEVIRSKYPKGKVRGQSKYRYTKDDLQRIKPSDILVQEEVEEEGEGEGGEEQEQEELGGAPGYEDFEI